MRRALRWGLALGLALAAVSVAAKIFGLYSLYMMGWPVQPFDEPIQLAGGLFVKLGQTPFADFRTVYPPLNYYVLAWLFDVAGQSVVTFRLYQASMFVLTMAAVAWHARKLGAGAVGCAFTLLAGALVAGAAVESMAMPAIGLAVVAVVLYVHALRPAPPWRRRLRLFFVGTLLTLSVLIRLNFALYVAAAIAADYGMTYVVRRSGRSRAWLQDATAIAIPAGIGFLWFAIRFRGHLGSAYRQMVGDTSAALAGYAVGIPIDISTADTFIRTIGAGFLFPALPTLWLACRACFGPVKAKWLPVALLVLMALGAEALIVWLAPERPTKLTLTVGVCAASLVLANLRWRLVERSELVVVLAATLSMHYFLSRPDRQHVTGVLPFLALLIPYGWPSPGRRRRALVPATVLALAVWPWLREQSALLDDGTRARIGREILLASGPLLTKGDPQAVQDAELTGLRLFDDPNLVAAVRSFRESTKPRDTFYSGLTSHRNTLINDLRGYWLSGRRTAVRDVMMMNGLTTSGIAESRIIHDLERQPTKFVLLWGGPPPGPSWGKQVFDSDGSLDNYVRVAYPEVSVFGNFELRKRR